MGCWSDRRARSDEGQLGQSIPQPVLAAAIERAREIHVEREQRRRRRTLGARVAGRGCAGATAEKTVGRWGGAGGRGITTARESERKTRARARGQGRGGGKQDVAGVAATPAPTTDAPPATGGATVVGILSA